MRIEVSTSIFIVFLLALVAALVLRPQVKAAAPKRYPFPTPPPRMRTKDEMNEELFEVVTEAASRVK